MSSASSRTTGCGCVRTSDQFFHPRDLEGKQLPADGRQFQGRAGHRPTEAALSEHGGHADLDPSLMPWLAFAATASLAAAVAIWWYGRREEKVKGRGLAAVLRG